MSYGNNIAKGDLLFGLSLMSYLGEGNVSISPTSVRTALAMIYEGAKGATARQIAHVAFLPEDTKARQEGFKELTSTLNATNVPYTLRCANGVWIVEKYTLKEDFKRRLTDNYRAEVQSADFERNPDRERLKINKWVSEKTEKKISELFPSGSIDTLAVLVLANALYFKAPWDNKFNPKYTQKQNYTLSNGETIKVDMMRKGEIEKSQLPEFIYGKFNEVQVVMLPYKGHQLVKMIMLPPKGSSVKSLEINLRESKRSAEKLYSTLSTEKFARLEIPKHEIKGSYDLVEPLTGMGIDRIFALDTAELSGIGPGPLFVNKGVHKTYFKTDEEGSEGAAATGFVVLKGGGISRPIEFVADRPFLEAIVDTSTGAFIFLNRIEDPR